MKLLHQTLMLTAAMTVIATAAYAEGYKDHRMDKRTYMHEKDASHQYGGDRSAGYYKNSYENRRNVRVQYDSLDYSEVREVQKSLNQNGYNLNVDGVWGPRTTAAIRSFQNNQDLRVTGNLDNQTLAALNVEIER